MNRNQAVLLSLIIVFSSPQLTQAQVFSDDITLPKNAPTFPSGSPSTTGDVSVTQDNPFDDSPKPNFLKDIFLGPSNNRPIHSSTLKLFDILGKAQKGLKSYKFAEQVYKGITGKNANSITDGVFGILEQYGIIDPQKATTASNRSTPILIGQGNQGPAYATAGSIGALKLEPKEPYEWRVKALNENIVYKNAIQKTGDFVYSPEAQEILKVQDQVAADARDAAAAAAQGGLESVLASTQVKDQSIYASTVVGEYGTSAQSAKSTQAVNKLETKQNTEIANILAGNAFQLNAINESMVRNTSALGNIVTTQSILVDKQTVSQYLDAAQLRQNGQIFTTLNNHYSYEKRKDMYQHLAAADTSNLLHFPNLVEPQPNPSGQTQP
ncbi:hypothetical protein [Acaryochloris marina]|uniref:Uncharacterized protein n=1 Tax=Acaryochloris marina (strain MBIC 11017) TaxID=329726 RepID=A8ZR10_ACAM1|nr:hypothetical protein [Acaryochloris marina]ABW33446.1 hypothetical protein AM1_H0096 [Acaryochloris marina MBIC11017]